MTTFEQPKPAVLVSTRNPDGTRSMMSTREFENARATQLGENQNPRKVVRSIEGQPCAGRI
jgi:hypothetical protein